MEIYFLIAAAGYGAIAGSFLNALLYRFNTGRGMGGRSYCDTCGATLGVPDLVPIFSYLFLRGRCRHCGSRIAASNILVELAAATLSVLLYKELGLALAYPFFFIVWMTLLFVVVYDLRHKIIPLSCSVILAVLSLASLFINWSPFSLMTPSWQALSAGPLLALPLFLIPLLSRGRWMGWGDGQLMLSIGWFLGLSQGVTALMLGVWSGAAVGILLILLQKGITMKSELPFAPFLVFGMFLAYFFNVDLFSLLSL